MICKNCETENTESSVFCKSCGFRLDGKKKCPACDCLNDEGNIYCNQCGTRIDGKKICSNCGGEIVGAFCSKCGTRYVYNNLHTVNNKGITGTKRYVNKILDITGSSVLLLCAVLSLIFIFFVGLVEVESNKEISIFYFFGKAYKGLKSMLQLYESYSASFETSIYLIHVLCTAVIGVCIICCLIFATLAIVRFIKKLCFGGEKGSALFSILSVIFYFVCVTSLKTVFYFEYNEFDENILDITTMYFKLNSITKTGVLLVLLSLLIYFGLEIAKKSLNINKTKVMDFVFIMINVVLSIVLVAISYNSFIKVEYVDVDGIEMLTSFSVLSCALAMLNPKVEILNVVVFSGIIQTFIILVIFFALFSLAKSFCEEKNGLAYSICIFVFLLIALVLQFVVINEMFDYFKKLYEISEIEINESNITISCIPIIVSFIISFLSLFANIIYSGLKAKVKSNNLNLIENAMR